MDFSSLFFFSIQAMKKNCNFVLPSNQRLHKSCFLQKLGCQKPSWDQARLPSLVNKNDAPYMEIKVILFLVFILFIGKIAVQCSAVQFSAVQFSTLQCSAVQSDAVQVKAVLGRRRVHGINKSKNGW